MPRVSSLAMEGGKSLPPSGSQCATDAGACSLPLATSPDVPTTRILPSAMSMVRTFIARSANRPSTWVWSESASAVRAASGRATPPTVASVTLTSGRPFPSGATVPAAVNGAFRKPARAAPPTWIWRSRSATVTDWIVASPSGVVPSDWPTSIGVELDLQLALGDLDDDVPATAGAAVGAAGGALGGSDRVGGLVGAVTAR